VAAPLRFEWGGEDTGNLRESPAAPAARLRLEDPEAEKRAGRFALRDTLLHIATHKRQRACGRFPSDPLGVVLSRYPLEQDPAAAAAAAQRGAELPAHRGRLRGVRLCDLIWTCPVCGPRIRQERAAELDHACREWLRTMAGPGASGEFGFGSVLFLTLTVPHDYGEALADVLADVRAAWSQLLAGRARQQDKARFGFRHYVRSHDVTVGRNGWHPHVHAVLMCNRRLTDAEVIQWRGELLTRWRRALLARGRKAPSDAHGIRLEIVKSVDDLPAYVLQVAGDGTERRKRVSLEVARGDLKTSQHAGQRTPWEVLGDYRARPNRNDLALWQEWERATRGLHAIQWSRGLRAAVGLPPAGAPKEPDPPAEGEEEVYRWRGPDWLDVSHRDGRIAAVNQAGERGGSLGVARLLGAYRATDTRGGALAELRPHILPRMRLEAEEARARDSGLPMRRGRDGQWRQGTPYMDRHLAHWNAFVDSLTGWPGRGIVLASGEDGGTTGNPTDERG
jgi:hypothetical protein